MFSSKITKIALFEPEMHHEVLEMLLGYFIERAEVISILTQKENINYIDHATRLQSKLVWQTFESKNKDKIFIRNWISDQQEVDLFIWITLSPGWYSFKIEKIPENSMLLIHNLHFWFNYENHKAPICYHLKTIWHQWIYFFSYREKQKRWLSRFRYWNSLVSFPFLPLQCIPLQHSPVSTKLSVVIPGSIRKNGRDYGLVIQFVEKLPSSVEMELVFLGEATSLFARRFLISVKKIKPQSVKMIYFDHYVPEDLFRFYLQRASFLWIPLMPHRYYGGVLEKVGFSAITGGLLDTWKYQRKCFLPQWYPIPASMKKLVLPYIHVDEIISQLSDSKRHDS
jgi:hypothetical protein